jgi:hypothetical protein
MMKAKTVIILFVILSIISFFVTAGIVWVVALAFDFAWSWKLSIAVWLILWVLTSLFKNK